MLNSCGEGDCPDGNGLNHFSERPPRAAGPGGHGNALDTRTMSSMLKLRAPRGCCFLLPLDAGLNDAAHELILVNARFHLHQFAFQTGYKL